MSTNKPISTNGKYTPIIGLEIHVELKTKSKMFCGCRNDPFNAPKPNIYTCPVCLGLPGALPVPNKKAIEWTVMLGLALGCTINKESKFDRKHYFYPDLPKGYQISQYDQPFCIGGKLSIADPATRHPTPTSSLEDSSAGARVGARLASPAIRVRRVHLEEDTAKMLHQTVNGEKVSLIDFNRSSIPLVEIVTEPDIRSAEEAKEFAKKIHQIVRSLDISDADMEKGSMRLEANVSLSETSKGPTLSTQSRTLRLSNYKVELKNINSFRFLEKAINSEVVRQEKLLEKGETILQETRGWDSKTQTARAQRTKEEAADYRYFPDPDIPPIRLTDQEISKLKLRIPKMIEEIKGELIHLGVAEQAAEVISSNKKLSEKILKGLSLKDSKDSPLEFHEAKDFANWILHHQEESENTSVEELLNQFRSERTEIIGDESKLEEWVSGAILHNPKAVLDFKAGKESAIQFLIGQVQRLARGKADVRIVKDMLQSRLTSHPERSRGI